MPPVLLPLMLAKLVIDYSSSIYMRRADLAVSRNQLPHLQLNHHHLTPEMSPQRVGQSLHGQIRGDQIPCGGVDISLPSHQLSACR